MVSQVAQFAPIYDVELLDVRVDLRATFDSTAKYGLSDHPTAFQKVAIQLEVKSSSAREQVEKLIAHAEMGCHAAQSFSAPVPVETQVTLNGERLIDPESKP